MNGRAGDEILVPAYNCGSEVEALTRAGFACRFYEGNHDLEPDENELDALLGPRVRALYVIHYLGFAQNMPKWRRWCDERGLALIEDAAQAWLSFLEGRPLGSFGDLAIVSLYKTFGLPDGAALVAKGGCPAPRRRPEVGLGLLAQRHAAWLCSKSSQIAAAISRLRPDEPFLPGDAYEEFLRAVAPEAFALGDVDKPLSTAARLLLPRVVRTEAAARRRANYEALLEELRDRVPRPFARLPAGTSPYAFPIESPDRATLLDRLAKHGIRALDLWPVSHPLVQRGQFARADSLRARVIALPVHQELVPGEVDRIVEATHDRVPIRSGLRLDRIDTLDDLQSEWSELADASKNLFATREWLSTWWRHFGRDRALTAAACRSKGGRLVAFLPLYRWSLRPLRIVRFLGHGVGDELGPICHPSDRGAVARALRRLLDQDIRSWDLFVGEQLPLSLNWNAVLGGKVLRSESSPVLRWPAGGWDDFLGSQSSHLRKRVRYQERRLGRHHDVRYRLADDPARLSADLDVFFALHRARWGEAGLASAGPNEAFHRDFANLALERGWLRLWFLELDGRPVSAWYGFRFAGIDFYYQSGWDPKWQDLSVGSVLVVHSIRDALDHGIVEYRFLRGGEEYKFRFASDDVPLVTLGVPHGVGGQAAIAAASLIQSVPALRRAVRAPLEA